jgi:hypothetical protein
MQTTKFNQDPYCSRIETVFTDDELEKSCVQVCGVYTTVCFVMLIYSASQETLYFGQLIGKKSEALATKWRV